MKPIVLTKVEHHQVNYHYKVLFEYDQLVELYTNHPFVSTKKEIKDIWNRMKGGDEGQISQVMNDAFGEIDIEWDAEYEDNWTDRKGGYDITYGVEK
jgi:hypothetical protein